MQLAYMIGQLANMADGKQEDIFDDLNLEDEDNIGVLTFDQIMRYWKYSGLPVLNEEMIEFLQYMAMRFSRSLNKVHYEDLCKIFNPDYILPPSELEDDAAFDLNQARDEDDLAQE